MVKKELKIKKYKIDGIAKDNGWITKNFQLLQTYIREEMIAHGFLPMLEREMKLFWEYDTPNDIFHYTIIGDCIWVGKKRIGDFVGVLDQGVLVKRDGGVELVKEIFREIYSA